MKALKIKNKKARETEQHEEATRRSNRRESIRKEFASEPNYVFERKSNRSVSSRWKFPRECMPGTPFSFLVAHVSRAGDRSESVHSYIAKSMLKLKEVEVRVTHCNVRSMSPPCILIEFPLERSVLVPSALLAGDPYLDQDRERARSKGRGIACYMSGNRIMPRVPERELEQEFRYPVARDVGRSIKPVFKRERSFSRSGRRLYSRFDESFLREAVHTIASEDWSEH